MDTDKIIHIKGYNLKYVKCDLCGADDTVLLGYRETCLDIQNSKDKSHVIVYQCKSCGLIYPNPMPFPSTEQFQANYSEPEQYFDTAIDENRIKSYEKTLKVISRYINIEGRLLDVGCGRGELVLAAKRLGWDAYGIDPSAEFVRYANEKLGINAKQGRIEEFNFPSEYFSVVCLSGVLQYVDMPKKLITEISRIIKKGGIIYIEDTNADSLVLILGDLFFKILGKNKTTRLYPEPPKFETYGFSAKTLTRYLEESGFKVLTYKIWGGTGGSPKLKDSFGCRVLCFIRKIVIIIGRFTNTGHMITVYGVKS